MLRQTLHKAWAGGFCGIVATFVAIAMFNVNHEMPTWENLQEVRGAVVLVFTLAVNMLVSFLVLYYAPRNQDYRDRIRRRHPD